MWKYHIGWILETLGESQIKKMAGRIANFDKFPGVKKKFSIDVFKHFENGRLVAYELEVLRYQMLFSGYLKFDSTFILFFSINNKILGSE